MCKATKKQIFAVMELVVDDSEKFSADTDAFSTADLFSAINDIED